MIGLAPTSAAPAIAASPTPPQPMTATVSSRSTLPVLIAAPMPAITPQPEQAGYRRVSLGVYLGALPFVDERLLDERADAQRRGEFGAVGQGHLLGGVVGVEAQVRATALAGPALSAYRAPVQDHEVADLDVDHAGADRLHRARGLVAQQEQGTRR